MIRNGSTPDAEAQFHEPRERPVVFSRGDAIRFALAGIAIVALLSAGVAGSLTPSDPGLAQGAVAPTTVRAPRDADIADMVRTQAERDLAANAVTPKYSWTPDAAASEAARQVAQLEVELQPVDSIMSSNFAPEARANGLMVTSLLPYLSSSDRAILAALEPGRWVVVEEAAVAALRNGEQTEIRDSDLAAKRTSIARSFLPTTLDLTSSESDLAVSIASHYFTANSTFSQQLTDTARAAAAAAVPVQIDSVKKDEVIVDQGHTIGSVAWTEIRFFGLDQSRVAWGEVGAWVLLVILAATILLGWLWRFRPEYWHRNRTLFLIVMIFVVSVLSVKIPAGRAWLPYIMPTAAAGMLLTLLLDAGFGVVVTALLALLAGLAGNVSLEPAAYVALGGFAGLIVIRKGEQQHYFLEAGIAVAVADIAVVGAFTMLNDHDMTGFLQLAAAAAGSAVISAIVALGSFSLLGNLFGILTGTQLLELSNPSRPLLRRLLMETPGTYHHSLMVGNLAERAASSIGADPLLVRCAAYYHDVGKLANPLAFIENQAAGENIHDQLDAEVSAKILKQHVPDGIDLAYKYKLPKPLIAFIPQHHGTAIMGYVYNKAREAAAAPFGGLASTAGKAAADGVDPNQYRHSGPKPQSKEAAILMLADGVEASVRSLSSRDEATIRAMVAQIIAERVTDGQLNECDLTIRDLESILEAFVGQLLGMYHQRIAYPQSEVVEIESRRRRSKG